MGGDVCSDDNKFNAPLPWVGVYIAGASLLCAAAMGADTVDGLRHRRLWFPCRLFPINATTLTLLSVATKLPLDLSSPMPAPQDQLTKLTGTAFICVAMAFSMPSFGLMQDPEILSNVAALLIFVVIVAGNVCTQLATGVIYAFRTEHALVLLCMLMLLALVCASALVVDTTNTILNCQYDSKAPTRLQSTEMEHIKDDVSKVWLMAQTSSPQYVMARSAMSTAAGALSCVCVVVVLQAEVRSFFASFCAGRSDYRWSTWPVVVSQSFAVLVGGVAPALRWFNATGYRKSGGLKNCREEFCVEKFWVQRLEEWKENPLPVYFSSRSVRKRVHALRNALLDVCLWLEKAALQVSKTVRLASALLILLFRNLLYYLCSKTKKAINGFRSSRSWGILDWKIQMSSVSDSGQVSTVGSLGLNNYVLHLEGEDDLVLWMSSSGHKDMDQWMERGKKEDSKAILQLLSKSSVYEGFKGMCFFDNDNIPPIPTSSSDIPPNCWTLPAVTLVTLALSFSRFNGDRLEMILMGFAQSLKLMMFVEKNLDFRGLMNMRKAATIVWTSIDLKRKWLSHDLANLPISTNSTCSIATPAAEDPSVLTALQIIESLAEIGKMHVMSFENELVSIHPRQWPPEALAGNSLYRISKTILAYNKYGTTEELLEEIERTLADIVGACLTNLPYAIFVEYVSGMVSERENRVRNAVFILGKAQNLQDALHWSCLRDPDDENANVDRWRSGQATPFISQHHEECKICAPLEEANAVLEWEQTG